MKTIIAVPCMDQVSALFAHSLATLNKVGEVQLAMTVGSLIYTARNDFAKSVISKNADALLFFDSDMTFPEDTLERMVKHVEDGKDIISGLYFKRRPPFSPVLYKELGYRPETDETYFEELLELPTSKEPFEVAGAGMGCCMITKNVLLDLALNYQTWFNPIHNMGEDLAFCIRARDLGYKIWCDPTISCGHVGQLTVTEAVWQSTQSERK